jgi:3-deoxy-D-manno-octulosonic-acid transferase
MYFLYSLLLTIGLILASPLLIFDAIRKGKYLTGLSQRLGKPRPINSDHRPVIWLHCVSVGETAAARTLVNALAKQFPSHQIAISTTTITGQEVARRIFTDRAAAIFYFPIDWAWTVRRVLRTLNPSVVLVMETELWPRLFHECRRNDIPVVLVNGRISDRSFPRYRLVRSFMREVLNELSLALVQSEQDSMRLRELGLRESKILTTGNLKFDTAETAIDDRITDTFRRQFGLDGSRPVIVAASTHDPEERIAIEAFTTIKNEGRARLIIAPRHPERFESVASLIKDSAFTWGRRSQAGSMDRAADIVLLDTVGELNSIYDLADIALVGGSITPHGGHNVLEPAARKVCVVTGPHTENFLAVTKALLDDGAMIQLPEFPSAETAAQLAAVLASLLRDEARRRAIGQKAQAVCRRNVGATERTVAAIVQVMSQSARRDIKAPASLPASAFK